MIDMCRCHNCGEDFNADDPYREDQYLVFVSKVDEGLINIDGEYDGNEVYSGWFCRPCTKKYLDSRK